MPNIYDESDWPFQTVLGVQTRSETTGINQYSRLSDALIAIAKDLSVWKISYHSEQGRVRFVRSTHEKFLKCEITGVN